MEVSVGTATLLPDRTRIVMLIAPVNPYREIQRRSMEVSALIATLLPGRNRILNGDCSRSLLESRCIEVSIDPQHCCQNAAGFLILNAPVNHKIEKMYGSLRLGTGTLLPGRTFSEHCK